MYYLWNNNLQIFSFFNRTPAVMDIQQKITEWIVRGEYNDELELIVPLHILCAILYNFLDLSKV